MGLNLEPAELTARAREAQTRRHWAEAERLWRTLLEARPNDPAALSGLGSAVLAQGRADEALVLAEAIRRASPHDVAGPTLAARAAVENEDWPAAIEHWRAVLAMSPSFAAAVTGLGSALLATGDLDATAEWAHELAGRHPPAPHGAILLAQIAEARSDSDEAIRLWRAAVSQFPKDKTARRELVHALTDDGRLKEAETEVNAYFALTREGGLIELGNFRARAKPDDDLTDYWRDARAEFPDRPIFLRREIASAMKAGRADDAIAGMNALLSGHDVVLADAGLVVGLVHIFAARGDMAALRRCIRDYLRKLRGTGTYRLAALRLCRVIFAYFAAPEGKRRLSYRERTRRMIRRAPLKPKPRTLLERSVALEESLAAQAPNFLDTDVSGAECRVFVAHVRERLARGEPFSFIRMNDAESNAFPYEPHLAAHFDADAGERENVWWGRIMAPDQRAGIAARVAESAWSADAIGIPTFARILRDVHLDENDELTRGRGGRGLRAGLAAFERYREFRPAHLPPPLFTSANLHQDLQRWNSYGELFDGVGEIVLVTCHPGLADAMKDLFGLGVSANILVPPRHATIPLMSERPDTPHILPEVIDQIVTEVRAHSAGRMVVVGAGYLGKWIIHQAKDAGGVALDLGSALDYWIGLKTRSYQDLA